MTIDHPNATPQHRQLAMLLRGRSEGMTRKQIATALDVSDRVARQIIEDLTAWGVLPLICDRGKSGREEGRYRIARQDEVERVNRELHELTSRMRSSYRRARGLRQAFQDTHQAGSLFLADVPALPEEAA